MKRAELAFGAALIPVDIIMIFAAGLTAYWLRLSAGLVALKPIQFDLPLQEYLQLLLFMVPFLILIFAFSGLYSFRSTQRMIDESFKVFGAISTGVMFALVVLFLRSQVFDSRFILIASWVLAVVFVTLGRYFVRRVQRSMLEYGIGAHRVVLVGANGVGDMLEQRFREDKATGYVVVGRMENPDIELLERISQKPGVDEIVVTDSKLSRRDSADILAFALEHKVDFKFVPDLFGARATNIGTRAIGGIPIIEIKRTLLDGWGRIAKRAFDFIGALLGLILLSPFFLIISAVIRLDSSGPVVVKLKRVGYRDDFYLYKFRSMVVGADKMKQELMKYNERSDGPLFKMKRDPRITRVGRWLRRTRVDEFPQLLNVLKGEMSLVGPRPHEPKEVAQYEVHHKKVLGIKPGITGLAQISGSSGLSFSEEIRLDTYYVESWSLLMDLRILLRTVFVLFSDPHAV